MVVEWIGVLPRDYPEDYTGVVKAVNRRGRTWEFVREDPGGPAICDIADAEFVEELLRARAGRLMPGSDLESRGLRERVYRDWKLWTEYVERRNTAGGRDPGPPSLWSKNGRVSATQIADKAREEEADEQRAGEGVAPEAELGADVFLATLTQLPAEEALEAPGNVQTQTLAGSVTYWTTEDLKIFEGTDGPPYRCRICGKTFGRSLARARTHMKYVERPRVEAGLAREA